MVRKLKQQVFLALQKRNKAPEAAKFYDCIMDYFEVDSQKLTLKCTLDKNHLILSETDLETEESTVVLRHSSECPVKEYPIQETSPVYDEQYINKGVNTAVSVVIESSDQHVLLTQRASSMRVSPNVWVPPGGHLDVGETLFDCGFREVKEETGLDLKKYASSTKVLCLWEAVFPLVLGLGSPRSHVLVVYLLVKVPKTYKELQKYIRINPREVQATTWLSRLHISELLFDDTEKHEQPTKYSLENGKFVPEKYKVKTLFAYKWWREEGRCYSGIQCALIQWYRLNPSKL